MEKAMVEEVRVALERRGYAVKCVSAAEAVELMRGEFSAVKNVGWGGSETVRELGLRDLAAEMGLEVRDHRTDCDLFLLSANALLADGRIVNIDGTGNRVAASIYGPKKVIYLIGRNKIVEGGIEDAIARIRRVTCPKNAKRLGRKTPCGLNGECVDPKGAGCSSPDRMCKVTVVFEGPTSRTPTMVLLVDADLGY